MEHMPNVLYLHGFASSPLSRKALWFQTRFQELEVGIGVPDLEAGDFRGLTITGMLDCVRAASAGERVTLMGSSLGGYVAALYASLWPAQVERLILMAPAFDFANMWLKRIGPRAEADWRRTGSLRMMHYGMGKEAEIGWTLMEDAFQYPAEPQPAHAALVLHGLNDDVVHVDAARRWCAGQDSRRLVVYEDGHELGEVLEPMWAETKAFLGLPDR